MAYKNLNNFVIESTSIGNATFVFKTEKIEGCELLDTEVKIGDIQLCWISYPEKQEFIKQLQTVLDNFRI